MRLALAIAVALAAGAASSTTACTGEPDRLSTLAGEYRSPHKIAVHAGSSEETWNVEDVLRIVKLSRTKAYLTVDLQQVNGHSCELRGIAVLRDGVLVHRGRTSMLGLPRQDIEADCVLRIEVRGGALLFSDENGSCHRNNCSGRAYFDGQRFPLSTRRPLKEAAVLLSSGDYARALEDDRQSRR